MNESTPSDRVPKPEYADTPGATSHIVEAPNEVLSTMNKDGTRKWMYPKLSKGAMYTRRKIVGWVLIVLFFGLPLIQINGEPSMWLDFIHRRFAIMGQVFYATDTLLLMLLGLVLVLAVVWATALFGRVWCGWGCPQTVYMEFIFRPIDRLIEGSVSEQRRRDKKGWTQDRIWRTGAKLTIYTLIAAAMAHTFVAYFVSWKILLSWMTEAPANHWLFFLLMGTTTALIVFDFAYFREQMCTIACPYARLQSVLMDRDSLIVSYDPGRGEPRARRSKIDREQESQGIKLVNLGDCIDCGACVRTCPTGIDIRDGLQLECIGCTQCIDACDAIMIGVNKPTGLIRYTSENKVEKKPSKFLRPRVILYTGLLVLFCSVLAYMSTHTSGLEISMIRATGDPFVVMPNGNVSNHFKLRAQNRTSSERAMSVTVLEPEGAVVKAQGGAKFALEPGKMKRIDLWIVAPPESFKTGQNKAKLRIGDGSEFDQIVESELLGPVSANPLSPDTRRLCKEGSPHQGELFMTSSSASHTPTPAPPGWFDRVPAHIRYPGMILFFLVGSVCAQMVLLRSALSNGGAQVESNYYDRAVGWEQEQQARQRIDALHYSVKLEDVPRGLALTFQDAGAHPVPLAEGSVKLTRPHLSEAVATHDLLMLPSLTPGQLLVPRPTTDIAGIWDITMQARDTQGRVFIHTFRREW